MAQTVAKIKNEKRCRKKSERTIGKNGLFNDQWSRIRADAQKQGLEGAQVLRQIVDWYHSAQDLQKDKEEYATEEQFKKLKKS